MRRNQILFLTCLLIFSLLMLVACGTTLNNENSAESPEKSQSDKNSPVNAPTGEDDDSDNEVHHFQGKGDNWKIKYTIFKGPLAATTTSESGTKNSQSHHLYIQYIGDDQPPKQIDYEIEDDSGKMNTGTDVTLKDGVRDSNLGNLGLDPSSKNDNVKAVIKWNGESETIDLKYE